MTFKYLYWLCQPVPESTVAGFTNNYIETALAFYRKHYRVCASYSILFHQNQPKHFYLMRNRNFVAVYEGHASLGHKTRQEKRIQ